MNCLIFNANSLNLHSNGNFYFLITVSEAFITELFNVFIVNKNEFLPFTCLILMI